jgi:nucleotide-binding universal stress UspA family protein
MNETRKHIVVGVDGSEESEDVLRWAGSFAKDLDAEVIAVYALTPLGEFTLSLPPFPPRDLRREFESELEDHWCTTLRDLGARYRSIVVESGPVSALLHVSDKEHAELIVVGGHRHGTLTDHVVGSVAARLVHRGKTPVVVVPVSMPSNASGGSAATGRPLGGSRTATP